MYSQSTVELTLDVLHENFEGLEGFGTHGYDVTGRRRESVSATRELHGVRQVGTALGHRPIVATTGSDV